MVSRRRRGVWKTAAQLSPGPLPGAALCALEPPQLLIAAPGSQLQHQPSLAAFDESGQQVRLIQTPSTPTYCEVTPYSIDTAPLYARACSSVDEVFCR